MSMLRNLKKREKTDTYQKEQLEYIQNNKLRNPIEDKQ